jgi:hypothetical protein
MDSECPAASRIAGQTTIDSGALFITAMWNTFKFGNELFPNLGVLESTGRRRASSGLHSYHHLADGDGR